MKKLQKMGISFLNFIRRENLHRLMLIIILLLLLSTLGMTIFEPEMTWTNALWWSIVTLTTVGYGDISPATLGGRALGVVLMFLGIGLLGMFTATIASVFVAKKIRENRGMGAFDFENHLILCEWNYRAREIVAQLRADNRYAVRPIVLIANIEEKPIDDENLFFIHGAVTEEVLERANVSKAATVIILGDDALTDANLRDSQVVLATLTVESVNPDAYTIVELINEKNVRHCRRARADEVIVGSQFSSKLIANAAMDHGVSTVLSELLTNNSGNDIKKISLPHEFVDMRFVDLLSEMKSKHNSILLAVQRGENGLVITNPGVDYHVERGDSLIVVTASRSMR